MKTALDSGLAVTLFVSLLVLPIAFPPLSIFDSTDRSWSRNFSVAAGDIQYVTGGIDFASDIQVRATVRAQSCCGFSTNDIAFSIHGVDYPEGLGVTTVRGTFDFEWNSGRNDRYDFIFDNEWLSCGGTPLTCARNESSPSYHDKTVELSVHEVAPLAPLVSAILWLFFPLIIGVAVVVLVGILVLLKKRKARRDPNLS